MVGTPRKVGFIGLGIMGHSMAGHLLAAGNELHISNRSRGPAAEALVEKGALWHDRPAELAAACDVVFTIVGYPADVAQVFQGPDGLVANAREGAVLVDMTTSSPSLAAEIAAEAAPRGVAVMDAPVSGGDVGAREGKLAIMVGGDADAFEKVRPLLELMGKTIALFGPAGAGQHAKMANQIAIAGTVVGVAESLAYAGHAGLNLDQLLDVIGTGAASSFQLNVLGRKMAAQDYAPGFFVDHFRKDLGIALDEAKKLGLDLPSLSNAQKLFDRLSAGGDGRSGTQAIAKLYRS